MQQTHLPALARRNFSWLSAPMGKLARGLIAAAGLVALARAAPPTTPAPDPADSQVAVPTVAYRSALPPRTADAPPVGPATWRAANDTAAHIGGWRAYLREAQAPEAAPAPASPPPSAHKHKH